MTANTPTPELVKRLKDYSTEWQKRAASNAIVLEAAATIARLTAERDALASVVDPGNTDSALISRIIMNSIENKVAAEAAEKRVKELSEKGMDEHIDNIILRKELNEMNAAKK